MKPIMFIIVFLLYISFSFAFTNLLNVNFTGTFPPSGWTRTGEPGNWTQSFTSNAGGTSPELKFGPMPVVSGYRRFISPPLNTTNYFELQLQFKQYLIDNPASPHNSNYGVEISDDNGATWTNLWSWATYGDYNPGEPTILTISSEYLNTSNFRIAFFYDDTPQDLLGWFIDDILLDVTKNAVYGTWNISGSPYYLTEDLGVPTGRSLIIQPGVQVIAQGDYGLEVNGSIRAEGTAADSIKFTAANHSEGWKGIYFVSSTDESILFKHCIFEWGNGITYSSVLSISSYLESVFIQNCRFSNNHSSFVGALFAFSAQDITVDGCLFKNNFADQHSAMRLSANGTITLSNSLIVQNQNYPFYAQSQACFTANSYNTQLILDSNTFADNYFTNNTCRFDGVTSMGMYFSSISINNTIFWNPNIVNELNFNSAMNGGIPQIDYCDIRDFQIVGASPNLNTCLRVNPSFYSNANYSLSYNSPCIDAGNPALSDPDGSRKDIGAIPMYKKPVIISVDDIPYDQGLKVKVRWSRSQADVGGFAGGYYSVFRLDESRNADAVYINSPLDLQNLSEVSDIRWNYRDTDYNFMGNVPAYNFLIYSLNCPTIQDSSPTESNDATFLVVYCNGTWFSVSDPLSGHSADNIPPDTVRSLMITKQDANMRLDWSPVTEGTYNGNSYPELNGIYYKIYAGDNPFFDLGPATHLTTTSNTFQILDYLTDDKKFFRIVTTDQ